MVLGIEPAPGSRFFITHLTHVWLDSGPNRIANARYVMVFEESADSDGILRIVKDDVGQYFKYAIEFEVDRGRYAPRDVARAVAEIGQARAALPPPAVARPCARVKESTGALALFVEGVCDTASRHWLRRMLAR
jgi:hypothetical protein